MSNVKYPWNKWFQRKRFRLIRGRDYHCMPHSMSVQIRNAAIQRGVRVRVQIMMDGTILVEKKNA